MYTPCEVLFSNKNIRPMIEMLISEVNWGAPFIVGMLGNCGVNIEINYKKETIGLFDLDEINNIRTLTSNAIDWFINSSRGMVDLNKFTFVENSRATRERLKYELDAANHSMIMEGGSSCIEKYIRNCLGIDEELERYLVNTERERIAKDHFPASRAFIDDSVGRYISKGFCH